MQWPDDQIEPRNNQGHTLDGCLDDVDIKSEDAIPEVLLDRFPEGKVTLPLPITLEKQAKVYKIAAPFHLDRHGFCNSPEGVADIVGSSATEPLEPPCFYPVHVILLIECIGVGCGGLAYPQRYPSCHLS